MTLLLFSCLWMLVGFVCVCLCMGCASGDVLDIFLVLCALSLCALVWPFVVVARLSGRWWAA